MSKVVNSCFLMISSGTYIGKVVVDGHYFGSTECPWSHEVNLVQPAVLGRVRLHTTNVLLSELTKHSSRRHKILQDSHDTVLVFTDNGSTRVSSVRPMTIVQLHNIGDDYCSVLVSPRIRIVLTSGYIRSSR